MLYLKYEKVEFTGAMGMSLLDAAEGAAVQIQSGCRAGACGRCLIQVDGDIEALSQIGLREARCLELIGKSNSGSFRLACQAKVRAEGRVGFSCLRGRK